MSTNAIKVSTMDLLALQEAVENDKSISEIRELLKNARLYHNSEPELQLPVANLMIRILEKYVVYPVDKNEGEELKSDK